MHIDLAAFIHTNWGLENLAVVEAPRQFVAETFVVQSLKGEQYFCKVVDKPLFIPKILASLSVLRAMHQAGFTRINVPIPTIEDSLYVLTNDTLVVLFNYIDAPQSYDYDTRALGRLIGQLHALSPDIAIETRHEPFAFIYKTQFERLYDDLVNKHQSDAVLRSLQVLIRDRSSEIDRHWRVLESVISACTNQKFDLVITHGDAGGNVLVKSPDDIYVIDWDEILLAPRERDLWVMRSDQNFMSGYRDIHTGYVIDQMACDFYVASQYFYYLYYYLTEITSQKQAIYRTQQLEDLRLYFDGWIRAHIDDVSERWNYNSD